MRFRAFVLRVERKSFVGRDNAEAFYVETEMAELDGENAKAMVVLNGPDGLEYDFHGRGDYWVEVEFRRKDLRTQVRVLGLARTAGAAVSEADATAAGFPPVEVGAGGAAGRGGAGNHAGVGAVGAGPVDDEMMAAAAALGVEVDEVLAYEGAHKNAAGRRHVAGVRGRVGGGNGGASGAADGAAQE